MVQRVADRLGQRGTTGDATERFRQPCLHRLDEWSTALLAHASALLGGLATDLVLDLVERGNLAQGFLGERRLSGGIDVIELASRMGPTESKFGDIARVCDQAAKSGVAIDLEETAEPLQMSRRMLALTVLAIDIGSGRMPRPTPGPVVDRVAPQSSGLGASPTGIKHRQRGVVSEYHGRGQHGAQHQFVQRRQPPTGAAHPGAQGGTIQCDTLAGKDLRLAIQRQMVGIFVDQHMRHQRLGGHAAVNGTLRRWRLHDRLLAGSAAIPRPTYHSDPQLGRHVVKHLHPVFADDVQHVPATGAGLVVDVDHHLDPRQMRRQRSTVALDRFCARRTRRRLRR